MSLSTHAPPILARTGRWHAGKEAREGLLRGSHYQTTVRVPKITPTGHSKLLSNLGLGRPLICAACKILANPAPAGMGMPALCLTIGCDLYDILENQRALTDRINRLEEGSGQEGAHGSLREYQAKVEVRVDRLTDRVRTQVWYHELSEQESEDEIDRMVGDELRPPPPRRAWCSANQCSSSGS